MALILRYKRHILLTKILVRYGRAINLRYQAFNINLLYVGRHEISCGSMGLFPCDIPDLNILYLGLKIQLGSGEEVMSDIGYERDELYPRCLDKQMT